MKAIDREIQSRERLLGALDLHYKATGNANKIIEKRFNTVPILAVVVTKQDNEDNEDNAVKGILMPLSGPSLESLALSKPTSSISASGSVDLGITRSQLQDLARGVFELVKAGVVHGDINDRNTLVEPGEAATLDECQGTNSLVLVDFGEIAPDYKNDAFALGELFIWCKERSYWGFKDQRKIEDAAQILKENGDFGRVLSMLNDERDE